MRIKPIIVLVSIILEEDFLKRIIMLWPNVSLTYTIKEREKKVISITKTQEKLQFSVMLRKRPEKSAF